MADGLTIRPFSDELAPAFHDYENLGFEHDAAIMRDFGARYERCDVAMRYRPPPS